MRGRCAYNRIRGGIPPPLTTTGQFMSKATRREETQSAGGGRKVSVHWATVTPHAVLTNGRLSVLGTPLRDWLVCGKCHRQQRNHSSCGADFDSHCWMDDCKASSDRFMYMDELARELPAGAPIWRLKR